MEPKRYIWFIDEQVLEYFRFGDFAWWQLALMVAVPLALLAYAGLALLLDRRARARRRRQRRLARLDNWLQTWELSEDELESLRALADDDAPLSLYRLLADPALFETRVHEALEQGHAVPAAERVRTAQGYRSGDLGAPMVSTRQLMPGDHFRVSVWEGGRPQHHYGQVLTVSDAGFVLALTDDGFRAVQGHRGEVDLFFLRDNDVEYRFPLAIRRVQPEHNRLVLSHRLVQRGHRPRHTRLPLLRPITFRLQPPVESEARGRTLRGALLEMSAGGFSLVVGEEVAEGSYLRYELPRPRGQPLEIVGRVLDCRPFAGTRWLVRCELRGLTPGQRHLVGQLLRAEQNRRVRQLATERRRRRREE